MLAPLGRMYLRGTKGLRALLIAISNGRAPFYRSPARAPLCASHPRKRPLLNLPRPTLPEEFLLPAVSLSRDTVRISCARAQSRGSSTRMWQHLGQLGSSTFAGRARALRKKKTKRARRTGDTRESSLLFISQSEMQRIIHIT